MKTYDERLRDVSERIARRRKIKTTLTTSCISFAVVVLALVLFVPFNTDAPSVLAYADSPYYSLIQKINEATYEPPEHANNFDVIADSVSDLTLGVFQNCTVEDSAINESTMNDDEYVEVTDNQVAGVIESDIIKRTTNHIYYLRGLSLTVYSIQGEDSQSVGSFDVDFSENLEAEYAYYNSAEMYLSQDGTTLTMVIDGYDSRIGSCTVLVNLDVTDPDSISETGRIYVTGNYLSSRVVDGSILLMSKYRIASDYDFSDESTFLPQIGQPEAMTSVAADDIISPEVLTSTQYTLVCMLDAGTLKTQDTAAFLSYSDEIYVSSDHIYATRSYTQSTGEYDSCVMTEISCLSYDGDALKYLGSTAVAGSVKNQYSMDEYEGVLRVVTSTSITTTVIDKERDIVSSSRKRSASLYCISLDDFSVIASVENFAPDNEQAESVRFDGDRAYVCTAKIIELTDPVFFFDLSDLNNITYTDTGTIDGYSSSLIDLGEGYLMGVGYSGSGGLKIEIYEEAADKVVSVCSYEADASFTEEYKAYLIDRDKNLIGLGIRNWNGDSVYLLLHFDGYEVNEVRQIPMNGALEQMRAVIIDGWLYVFGDSFTVEGLW